MFWTSLTKLHDTLRSTRRSEYLPIPITHIEIARESRVSRGIFYLIPDVIWHIFNFDVFLRRI